MRILGIVSGKGGVGKTTTATNLAVLLARHYKQRVLAVDANLLAPNLGLHFGIYNYGKTFTDVLRGNVELEEAIQVHSSAELRDSIQVHSSGVHILPATPTSMRFADSSQPIVSALRGLEGYDFIILDTGPGPEKGGFPVLEVCDEILVVTVPEYPAVVDAKRAIEVAKASRVLIRGVVLNRFRKVRWGLSPVDVQYVCEVPVVSIIPDREEVARSISAGLPVVLGVPRSPAALEFRRLAAFMAGERYEEGIGEKLANLLWFRNRISIEARLRKAPVPPLPTPRGAPRSTSAMGEVEFQVVERPLIPAAPAAPSSPPLSVREPPETPPPPPVREPERPPPPVRAPERLEAPILPPRELLPPSPPAAPVPGSAPARVPAPFSWQTPPPEKQQPAIAHPGEPGPPLLSPSERKRLEEERGRILDLLKTLERQSQRGYLNSSVHQRLKELYEERLYQIQRRFQG